MDLEEFVKKSLVSISNGVAAAQKDAKHSIAPSDHKSSQLIRFEVVVTTTNEAGAGIKILSFADARAGTAHEAINKLTFSVPMYLQKKGGGDAG